MLDDELFWGTPEDLESAIEELRRNHPGWSQRVFLLFALEQFRELDHARRRRQIDAMTDYLVADLIEDLRREPPVIDIPIKIEGVQIAAVFEDGEYDVVDVRFVGERVNEGQGPGSVYEYLRFIRPRYEHTTDGETGVSDRCLRCGGSIDSAADWKCRYCDQLVNEQSSGWLISRVMDQGTYVS